jgi:hypothetical protein
MRSLPAWAIWSIVVPFVLFSPVIAFFLAMLAEAVICGLIDAGAPAPALLGAAIGGLILCRRLRGVRGRSVVET